MTSASATLYFLFCSVLAAVVMAPDGEVVDASNGARAIVAVAG